MATRSPKSRTCQKRPFRLRAALAAVSRGQPILPLRPGDKRPLFSGGAATAITSRSGVKKLFRDHPDANFGIATGEASGLLVLDIDGPKGYASIQRLEALHGTLPETTSVSTHDGLHLYFRNSGTRLRNSAAKLGPGLDTRGEGGYVVGVGSLHPKGLRYRYARGRSPKRARYAELPEWISNALLGREAVQGPATPPLEVPADVASDRRLKTYVAAAIRNEVGRVAGARTGTRNDVLNKAAFALGQLASVVPNTAAVKTSLAAAAATVGLDAGEIGPTIESGFAAGQRRPRDLSRVTELRPVAGSSLEAPVHDTVTQDLAKLGRSDTDNALRLTARSEGKLIFVNGVGFLAWSGNRWTPDHEKRRYVVAADTARAIAWEADFLPQEQAGGRRALADQSLGKVQLERMIELATPHLSKPADQLDADPHLLNVGTGTLDLRTGELRAATPNDLITKLANLDYDPNASCPLWDQFLIECTANDRQLIRYLRRAVGYSLTGLTDEQVFFVLHGPGATGKSVFVNTVTSLLSDYAVTTPFSTFLIKPFESIPADLAALKGARVVVAAEANVGQRMDEAKIKAFTGQDTITARHLYQNFSSFRPEGKLWLVTNDLPMVRSTSDSFWRRARVIPFTVKVGSDQLDRNLAQKLTAELPGILNWALRGCRGWSKHGLGTCPAVERASRSWMDAADHLRSFVEQELVVDGQGEGSILSAKLHAAYKTWANKHGEIALSIKELKERLPEFGLVHRRTRRGSEWRGVGMRT